MAENQAPSSSNRICTLPDLIVNPDWLAARLDAADLRIIDVRPADAYTEGHIPGAVQIDLAALTQTVDGVPGMVLDADAYAAVMGQLGVDDKTSVVLYDDNWGMPAARVLWTLAVYGHTNAALLNGGWDRWEEEAYPISASTEVVPSATFTARPRSAHVAELEWLRARLDEGSPELVVVDTRTPGEFADGHLPNAVNWDWMNGVAVEGWDAVGPAEEVTQRLHAQGITPDKEIVTYCRSGARAAHTYALLRHLGYPRVRNFDGSWLEWSARVLGNDHT